jgi:hypothetical protein
MGSPWFGSNRRGHGTLPAKESAMTMSDSEPESGSARLVKLLALPSDSDQPPSARDRLSVYLLALLPWLVLYEVVQALGRPAHPLFLDLPFERRWPVIEWTEAVYASAYLFVPLVPLLAHSRRALRRYALMGLLGTVVVGLCWFTIPVVAAPRPFEAHSWLGRLLLWERSTSVHVAAFPSFHVLWAMIGADTLGMRSRLLGTIGWTWATLITVSCVTAGQHALADLLAGALLFIPVRYHRELWLRARRGE